MPSFMKSHFLSGLIFLTVAVVCVTGSDDLLVFNTRGFRVAQYGVLGPEWFHPPIFVYWLTKGFAVFLENGTKDGCNFHDIPPPPIPHFNNTGFEGALLVVEASNNCSDGLKAFNAKEHNYVGLIIITHNSSVYPVRCNSSIEVCQTLEDDDFTAVTLTQKEGSKLKKYAYPKKYIVEMRFYGLSLWAFALPIIVVLILLICCMGTYTIVKCYLEYRKRRRKIISKKHLKKLPTAKFCKDDERLSKFETCTICLDEFIEGEKVRILPCHHFYHQKCIDPWLLKNNRACPICKQKVWAPGEVPSDSEDDSTNDHAENQPLIPPSHDNSDGATTSNSMPRLYNSVNNITVAVISGDGITTITPDSTAQLPNNHDNMGFNHESIAASSASNHGCFHDPDSCVEVCKTCSSPSSTSPQSPSVSTVPAPSSEPQTSTSRKKRALRKAKRPVKSANVQVTVEPVITPDPAVSANSNLGCDDDVEVDNDESSTPTNDLTTNPVPSDTDGLFDNLPIV